MLQTSADVLFIGVVDGRWVAATPRGVTTAAWLPLGRAQTATEALEQAHLLFPEALVAVKRLAPARQVSTPA